MMSNHDELAQQSIDRIRSMQAHRAVSSSLPFDPPRTYVFRKPSSQVTLHNVTRCCQCGATIGRGRDGRRCKACREKAVDDLSDVALPYGFGGKPVVELRTPGEVQQ